MSTLASDALAQSYAHCQQVARTQAANFYYGMKLTPEPKRSAMYAVYAWMRRADDLADGEGDLEEKRRRIEEFRQKTRQAMGGAPIGGDEASLWPAFADCAAKYRLSAQPFMDMLDGQMLDQSRTRYRTFAELYDYCYKVASTVGLICIEIWGYRGTQPRQWAQWRGIAFQLTNILRDLREDAQRGRVYLPAELMGRQEIDPAEVLAGPRPELLRAVRRLGLRAAVYYRKSTPLEADLDRDGVACSLAMCGIYRGLLYKILQDPQRVFTGRRVRLGKWRKTSIAMRALRLARRKARVQP